VHALALDHLPIFTRVDDFLWLLTRRAKDAPDFYDILLGYLFIEFHVPLLTFKDFDNARIQGSPLAFLRNTPWLG
jgi:hypothetical protein